MHIAICDDHIADRKHLERLLGRESDSRLSTTGVLYVDSYGDTSTVMRSPNLYDLFFIDMTEGELTGIHVAQQLREAGVTAPLVMCSSSIDYSTSSIPEVVMYVKKPLSSSQITQLIDAAITIKANVQNRIELRTKEGTSYVKPDEILYITSAKESQPSQVHLSSGEILKIYQSLTDFLSCIPDYKEFVMPHKKLLVNLHNIKKIIHNTILFSNDSLLRIPIITSHKLRKLLEKEA